MKRVRLHFVVLSSLCLPFFFVVMGLEILEGRLQRVSFFSFSSLGNLISKSYLCGGSTKLEIIGKSLQSQSIKVFLN